MYSSVPNNLSTAPVDTRTVSTIRDNLRRVMERQTISVRELARRAAVKSSFIYDILNGKSTNPSTIKLARVAESLGITLAQLLESGPKDKPNLAVITNNARADSHTVWVPWACRQNHEAPPPLNAPDSPEHPPMAFLDSWLLTQCRDISMLAMLAIADDAMAPTLQPGDYGLIDRLQTLPSPPGLFVIDNGISLVVRRLEYFRRSETTQVHLGADNPHYRSDTLPPDELPIIGRVIWVSRCLTQANV